MNYNIILIILGEPNSTFSELLFKYFKSKNFKKNKNKIVLIGNKKLFKKQMRKLKYNFLINEISDIKKSKERIINIINVDFKFKETLNKILSKIHRRLNKS